MNHADTYISGQRGYVLLSMIITMNLMLLLLMMLIVTKMHQKSRIINQAHSVQVRLNTLSAAFLVMEQFLDRKIWQPDYTACLFGMDRTSVRLEYRGVYYAMHVNSRIGQISGEKHFLIGARNNLFSRYTIILTKHADPLVISETCRISGTILVNPQQTIRNTDSTHAAEYTIRRNSETDLPVFNSEFIRSQQDKLITLKQHARELKRLRNRPLDLEGKAYLAGISESGGHYDIDNITVNGPGIIFLDVPARITSANFFGAVTIFSHHPIVFGSSNHSDDLLVFAPEIEIQGASLSGQFIAERAIHLLRGSRLLYPSALVLLYPSGEPGCAITVDTQCAVRGSVIATTVSRSVRTSEDPRISTSTHSIVEGLIYSDGYVELKGIINGSIIAPAFFHIESPTVYPNRIESLTLHESVTQEARLWPVCISGSNRHGICAGY